jgi:hypothetical protein
MIISKPKPTALIALGVFIIICFGTGGYALNNVLSGTAGWFGYTVAIFTLGLGFVLLLRQLLSYKVVKIAETIIVNYPFRLQTKTLKLKELNYWKQTIIKTKNDPFKQLELSFDNYSLKLSIQENMNYDQIHKFLRKKASRKEEK